MRPRKFSDGDLVVVSHTVRAARGHFNAGREGVVTGYDTRTRKYMVEAPSAAFKHLRHCWIPVGCLKRWTPAPAKPYVFPAPRVPEPPRNYVLVLDVAKARYYGSESEARGRIIELAKEAADRKAPQGVYAVCEVTNEIVPRVTTSVELTNRAPERK